MERAPGAGNAAQRQTPKYGNAELMETGDGEFLLFVMIMVFLSLVKMNPDLSVDSSKGDPVCSPRSLIVLLWPDSKLQQTDSFIRHDRRRHRGRRRRARLRAKQLDRSAARVHRWQLIG